LYVFYTEFIYFSRKIVRQNSSFFAIRFYKIRKENNALFLLFLIYFITFIASFVTLFLSNLFTSQITKPAKINVAT